MNTPEPLSSPNVDDLTHTAVTEALAGEHRARRVTIGTRTGIVTPHYDDQGDLDPDDLAAQIWALANDEASDNGHYTGGSFNSRGTGYFIGYIPPETS